MCCRTSVQPLDPEIATAILTIGRFQPTIWSAHEEPVCWERAVPEEQARVVASLVNGSLELSLTPAICSFVQHQNKRVAASIYFEIAAKYAEKVGGEVLQKATVSECRPVGGHGLIIARYPGLPLTFDNVCRGFQSVLIG
jgi:hypothetical protein